MGSVQTRIIELTRIPRFKEDAQQPWVTKEGIIQLSVWMHPKSTMTLEDVARLIEQYAVNTTAQQLQQQATVNPLAGAASNNTTYSGIVNSMTFRGQVINRSQLFNYAAVDYMKDGENFSFLMTQTFQVCCVVV